MKRDSSLIGMLAFAVAGAQAQQVMHNLYSDAFIAENAFSNQSNSFNMAPQELKPVSIKERAESKTFKRVDVPLFDPKEVKSKMKYSFDLKKGLPVFDPSTVKKYHPSEITSEPDRKISEELRQ